jgi:hypothetical protein
MHAGACTACSTNKATTCSASGTTNHLGCERGYYLSSAGTCTACTSGAQ